MKRMDSSWASGTHVTDFFFLPFLAKPVCGGVLTDVEGGVDTTGDSLRAFAIDLSASWNGSIEEG